MLTATATLATAAFTLLAPLESQLKKNSLSLTEAVVAGAKTQLGVIRLLPTGQLNRPKIQQVADKLDDANDLATLIIWTRRAGRIVVFVGTDRRRDARIAPTLAATAFRARSRTAHAQVNDVLEVADRYRAQNGRLYVLEMFKAVDYVGQANSAVRSAFLDAALVGLAVALLLGITLSSRLLRRLRLLQDASRTLDERDLGTLVVPHDVVSDEIGELARGFATMHARLRQQEDARRAFVATASHELRTPLTSIRGYAELFRMGATASTEDTEKAMARIEEEATRMGILVEDLLALARLDEMPLPRREAVDLEPLARDAADDARAAAREREVTLTLAGEHIVSGDPSQLRQVLANLMRNALTHTPAGSPIELSLTGANGSVRIEVRDHGPGLPQGSQDSVFERFWRSETGRERGRAGAGLGLAIVAAIVAAHGGKVSADNAPGGGAVFTIELAAPAAR